MFPTYWSEPNPRINIKIKFKNINPTANPVDLPNDFARLTYNIIIITMLTIGSNINKNKTYMTSQNFLIGAALISIFVMNILLAMFLIRSIDDQKASIIEAKNEMIEFRSELKKGIDEEINQQNDVIAEFIRINRGR